MPVSSILGGLISAGGANASGAAAAQAGVQAYQNALQATEANKSLASPYLLSGYAGTNALLQALGLGHFNGFNVDGGPISTRYGETSLNTSDVEGDRANALASFKASPGYQWRLDQGTRALDRSAASRGMVLSGAQQQGVTDYAQGRASDEWGSHLNRLSSLSGQGAGITGATNGSDTSALNSGNALSYDGAMNRASSYSNAANALASGVMRGVNSLTSLGSYLGAGTGMASAGMPGSPYYGPPMSASPMRGY